MKLKILALVLAVLLLSIFLLVYGESGFNMNSNLLLELRLPKVIVCLLAGGLLAIAGLIMQIFFQNPLAGPDILGVSAGSSLFVAFWMMSAAGTSEVVMNIGMSAMAFLGAISVFLILIFLVHKNLPKVSLIIVGLLISSFASSGISILINSSQALPLKNFLLWSMGSFRNVTSSELTKFFIISTVAILPMIFLIKALNQFLLSENYAASMGLNIKKTRILLVSMAALQISIVTIFCGPIGFIGIISPHLGRNFLKHSQIKTLIPVVFLIGSLLALFAEGLLVFIPSTSLSVNAILGLIGAPIIVAYLYKQREWSL